jgi:hypothetical protein
MVNKAIIVISLFFPLFTVAQNKNLTYGKYVFKGDKYYECLELKKNGYFFHKIVREFLNLETHGNWRLRNDSLILDSNPQKEKLIVWENRVDNYEKFKVTVSDKSKNELTYHITAILFNGDTLSLRDQWNNTIFDTSIKTFTITDTKGLKSPIYVVKGQNVNQYFVLFETARVFENEAWRILNKKIIPKGFNGMEQSFQLVRSDD